MQSDPSPSTSALTAPSEAHLGASEADRDSAGGSRPPLHRDQSSTSGRPRGILKNAHPSGDAGTNNEGVRWDEVNLNLNEVEREATTRMQITEPKTPFVRYDAETDTVEDLDKIPGFELGQAEQSQGDEEMEGGPAATASGSTSASTSAQAAAARQPSISSRSSSFSGSRRGSETSRRSSDVSERKMVVVEDHGPGVDAEDEGADEETRQAKKDFKERRGSHYSGEGEMMKRFRAGILELDDEDEDESAVAVDQEEEEEDDDDMQTGEDGNAQANGQSGTREKKGRRIPPVPPLPNGTA